jgi:hypothetical protein
MDSKLDPVFRTAFRHAESTDARLGIRREEPQGDQRRGGDGDTPHEREDPWQDVTSVSIRALRTFLAGLLGQAGQNIGEKEKIILPTAPDETYAARPAADPAAARAAGAYRATAGGGATSAPPAAPAGPAVILTPDEIRVIHGLIDDLDRLSSRQIEELRIEKNGTFLESLAAAARRALAAGG